MGGADTLGINCTHVHTVHGGNELYTCIHCTVYSERERFQDPTSGGGRDRHTGNKLYLCTYVHGVHSVHTEQDLTLGGTE